MDGAKDADQTTDGLIRKTYAQLITARNAQLTYIKSVRQRHAEFAFLVSPDLVLQYNHVHQLMNAFRPTVPPDICKEDGGITCSNLSVLRPEQVAGGKSDNFPVTLPVADGSDYLASRIVDLLDRPVAVGDQELTLNVRDELAANIRALHALFEERYRICQEQGNVLKNELSTVREALAANRSATATTSRIGIDESTRRLREQIARYEMLLLSVRQQLETLREANEQVMRRNQREIEELVNRSALYDRKDFGEAFALVIQNLFDSLETERDRVLATLNYDLARNTVVAEHATQPTADEMEIRVQNEVAVRVENELAARWQELESRVEAEVNGRVAAAEQLLRKRVQDELDTQTVELQRRFDEEVSKKVAERRETPTNIVFDLVNAKDILELNEKLDRVFQIKEYATNIIPMLPQYALSEQSGGYGSSMNTIYMYLEYLLEKMQGMYTFLIIQSEYVKRIRAPLLFNTKQVARAFSELIDQVLNNERPSSSKHDSQPVGDSDWDPDGVLQLLERILGELPRLRNIFEDVHRIKEELAVKQRELDTKQRELDDLNLHHRIQSITYRNTQNAISKRFHSDAAVKDLTGDLYAGEDIKFRSRFRVLFNELAELHIDFRRRCEGWFEKHGNKTIPPFVRAGDSDLKHILSKADKEIDFGFSPVLRFR